MTGGARAAALCAALLLCGCGSKAPDPARIARARALHVPGTFHCRTGAITIGMVRAQSGGFAFFDTAGANGTLVAVDIVNRGGGIDGCPIEVIRGNTQSDPAMARQVAEELIRDGADIIVTPGDFDMGVGASQAAQEAGKLSVSFEASASAWSKAIGPYHFTTAITEVDQGRAMAAYAVDRKWNAAYIVTNGAFNVFTATEKAFLAYYPGRIVGHDMVADDAADYSAVVSKIRAAGDTVGFIFLNDYFPHVGTFVRQLRAAGVMLPVLGNQNFSTPALAGSVGGAGLRGVYYVAQGFYEGSDLSPGARLFTGRYRQLFGSRPDNANALAGFEGMTILANALKQAKTSDAAPLAAAIARGHNAIGPTSTIYAWADRHPLRNATIIAFDDHGAAIRIGTIDPRMIAAKP